VEDPSQLGPREATQLAREVEQDGLGAPIHTRLIWIGGF
jgi:hypothetical protein